MSNSEPLSTLNEVKVALLNLADNYKSMGEKVRAHEILRETYFRSENGADIHELRELYFRHLSAWEKFIQLVRNTG